jgi:hypothetical protein
MAAGLGMPPSARILDLAPSSVVIEASRVSVYG